MNNKESIILDIARFTAAFIVFLNHASSEIYTDGFMWWIRPYAQTSVMAFFVISGFVIALPSGEAALAASRTCQLPAR
jgi:peptidoglycan/LPS O-acetylase OafA/YrhL